VIQAHLKKLFAGINNVVFDKDDDLEAGRIISICSLEGEVVPLSKPIDVKKSVEVSSKILFMNPIGSDRVCKQH